jgi:hypothetical protein
VSAADTRFDDLVQSVDVHRRTGDVQQARGNTEAAKTAWEAGLGEVEKGLLDGGWKPSDEADLSGMQGGLLRRLGRTAEALASYRLGADIEARTPLKKTYNRSNAIKLALISGESTLASVASGLVALEAAIEDAIRSDVQVASDAWTYADLGDTQLLLGHVGEAADAYRTFSERARSDSPTTTLSVLRQIVDTLRARPEPDPDASRLAADVERIESLLTPR